MKSLILLMAVVICVGCASTPKVVPNSPEAKAAIEYEIRRHITEPSEREINRIQLYDGVRFSLSDKQITDVGALAGFTQLEVLYLSNNQLTDVSPLASLVKLWRLSLGKNQLTDISPLAGLTKLEVLSLSNNQLTDIRALAGLTKLRELSLGKNQLTDIRALAGLAKLHKLWLNNNQLTNDQLKHLAGLRNLRMLSLRNNPGLTKVEIEKLEKLLPPLCRIYHDYRSD